MCIMGNMDLLSRNLTNSMAAYGIASLARWSFGSTPKNLSLHPGPLLASCLLGKIKELASRQVSSVYWKRFTWC